MPAITFVAMSAMAPAFAAVASAATVSTVSTARPASLSAPQATGSDDDVSGLGGSDSPVCSALDSETIPTGDVVAQCLRGTHLI